MKTIRKASKADLAAFTDQTGTKPALAAPWTDGGYTYASDGYVLLRTVARANAPATNYPLTPIAEKMFADHPAPDAPKFQSLPPSIAKQKLTITCRECRGSGAVLDETAKPILCPRCLGEKSEWNRRGVPVGRMSFAAHYLVRLAKLPGLRVAPPTRVSLHPMRFAFGGGEGLLMPVNPKP